VRAAKLIRPKVIIPMHYNTFDVISQDPKSFASRVKRALPKTKVVVLKPGESFSI
jgi:L-ascorbate metabolism protein UlaG (beta-lactamase superfamily)